MQHEFGLSVGPVRFRIGSAWRAPVDALRQLYAGYPSLDLTTTVPDATVRLQPTRPWRRWLRPAIFTAGDHWLADAAPLALRYGLLAAEMGMNLQVALGWRRHLLLHASCVEKDGRALVMTGESGSGKSTLSALLGERGWRFLADEFVLLDLEQGLVHPFPRLVSLKNSAIPHMESIVPVGRWGPRLEGTPKGTIRHMVPPAEAISRMMEPAIPALLLFPRFGFPLEERFVGRSEAFVRLTQASTNYVALGEAGFGALTRFVNDVPALALDYPDTAGAIAGVEKLWAALS